MKRFLCVLCVSLLLLCGCDRPSYTKTPETEKALETYLEAVRASEAATAGRFTVTIEFEDTVIQKKSDKEQYVYDYTVDESGAEHFTYTAYDANGKLVNEYKTQDDGRVINTVTGEPSEDYSDYLTHKTNPISTLTLFRMDSNLKLRHSVISSVEMTEKDGKTEITVVFHPQKLTRLSVRNGNGLVRNITEHIRVYTITDGKITGVAVTDRENAVYKQEKGTIDTYTTVEVQYA